MLSDIQKITLRDVFRDHGLTERQIEDIFLLLYFKPENVQQAFYYTSIGFSYLKTSEKIHVSTKQAWKYVNENCEDIKTYLKMYISMY